MVYEMKIEDFIEKNKVLYKSMNQGTSFRISVWMNRFGIHFVFLEEMAYYYMLNISGKKVISPNARVDFEYLEGIPSMPRTKYGKPKWTYEFSTLSDYLAFLDIVSKKGLIMAMVVHV